MENSSVGRVMGVSNFQSGLEIVVPHRLNAPSPLFRRRKNSSLCTEIRLGVIGITGVGKNALTVRFLTRRYIGEYDHTTLRKYRQTINIEGDVIGADIAILNKVQSDEETVRWTDGLLLVYSITDRTSFEAIFQAKQHLTEIKKNGNVSLMLVANKSDLAHYRKVSLSEGEILAKELGCPFIELSASNDIDKVSKAFHDLYKGVKSARRKVSSRPSSIFDRVFGSSRDKKN